MTDGLKEPHGCCQYKSTVDGLYYNGYMMSPEGAEEMFGEVWREIAESVRKDIEEMEKLSTT